MLSKRALSGSILAIVSIIFIFLGIEFVALEVLIISLIGISEFYDLASCKEIRPSRITGIIGSICLVVFVYICCRLGYKVEAYMSLFLTFFVFYTLIIFLFRKEYHVSSILDISATILGLLYVTWLLSYTILIRNIPQQGAWLLLLVIAATCFSDIGAYFIGKFAGRRKLWPQISPKKTVEGSIGGLIASVAITIALGSYLRIHLSHLLVLGVLIAVAAQIGDLCESLFKRDVGVKDAGTIILGHGGVLDRFDSLFFTGFVAYFYFSHVNF